MARLGLNKVIDRISTQICKTKLKVNFLITPCNLLFVHFRGFSSYAKFFYSKPFFVLLQVLSIFLLQGGFKGDSTPLHNVFDHFGLDSVWIFRALFTFCIFLFDLFYASELSVLMQEGLKSFHRFTAFLAICK
jgi:hypothetical protein